MPPAPKWLRHAALPLLLLLLALSLAPSASAAPTCTDPHLTATIGTPVLLANYCTSGGTTTPQPTGVTSGPLLGELDLSNFPTVYYVPAHCGADQIGYTSADDSGTGAGVISINVVGDLDHPCPVNYGPTCTDFKVTVRVDTDAPLTQTPPACVDPDGVAGFDLVPGHGPAHGSALIGPNGPFYRPNPGYTGADVFQFTARDRLGATSNVATITVVVTASALPPGGGTFTTTDPALPATTITSPNGGLVGMFAVDPSLSPVPAAYSLLSPGQEYVIAAPDATSANPITITFQTSPVDAHTVTVVRNGQPIDTPCDPNTAAAPAGAPCYIVTGSDAITIRTEHASFWALTLSPKVSFQQPIDGNALNVAKLGRVVPVKLTISSQAAPITSGNVSLSRIVGHTCTSAGTDVVETYSAAGSSNSGTSFRSDGSGGWIYNLSTANFPGEGCYRGYVSLNGSTVAHFDLKLIR